VSNDALDILLVEDDDAIRESLAECLTMEGLTVEVASDGMAALAFLDGGRHPRLLLVDLLMPRMGGAELMARLQAHPGRRALKVVLMTAATLEAQLPKADAVLTKPFELDTLLEVVRRQLAGS